MPVDTYLYWHPTDRTRLVVRASSGWYVFRANETDSWHVRERYVGSTAALDPLTWTDQNIQRSICGVPPEV
jgi:hypothetical protein